MAVVEPPRECDGPAESGGRDVAAIAPSAALLITPPLAGCAAQGGETELPDAPLVALVVQEEEAAPMLEEPVDDEEMDSPGMMDVELDELAEDEVAAISERLKDWPRS